MKKLILYSLGLFLMAYGCSNNQTHRKPLKKHKNSVKTDKTNDCDTIYVYDRNYLYITNNVRINFNKPLIVE